MSKTVRKGNNFRSLPPNFEDLDSEMRKAVEEQLYKQQCRVEFGYRLGDPRLISGDKTKKIFIKEED